MNFHFTLSVAASHPCLPGHFPGNPLVPGVVVLGQVCRSVEATTGCRVEQIEQAKFHAPLLPDETAVVHCSVNANQATFKALVRRSSAVAPISSGTLRLRWNENSAA
jgi:3-hydroxyacyl-[acyl-carrier-protein] dehydratase